MRITELGRNDDVIYILASNTLKPSGVSWEARAESSIVSQVSVIEDVEQL